ncbi:MAG: pyridoxamine 5'-phosphate oxidase family protein [bacterium]
MDIERAKMVAGDIICRAEAAYLTTMGENGLPTTRAMLNLHAPERYPALVPIFAAMQSKGEIYFTTNSSSRKVGQLQRDARTAVYYCLPGEWSGLCLSGVLELVTDRQLKERLWQPAWAMYYPAGPDDLEYAILRLCPTQAELYHQLDGAKWEPGA